MSDDMMKTIADSIVRLDDATLKAMLKRAMEDGVPVEKIIRDGLGKGMEDVGLRYETGDFFLSELIMAATLMDESMELIKPLLKYEDRPDASAGKIIIGTVQGDMHDIGKNIVIAMLESAGFQIIDLGIDVSPQKFVEAIKKEKPDIVSMSVLLSATVDKIKETIGVLKSAGLRDTVKVLVGGRAIDDRLAGEMGADSYGDDAWDAVRKAKMLLS
ncbi:MAG: B12-binding domain-containing protein [Promethearchaeota archaeon]